MSAFTQDFKVTFQARARRDKKFRQALLQESVSCILNGEIAVGKVVLRDYVNATVGFPWLEAATKIPAKSLMRMLGPKGSPSIRNFSSILSALKASEGVEFELSLESLNVAIMAPEACHEHSHSGSHSG